MDLIRDFDVEVDLVMEACQNIVAAYPPGAQETAVQYLEKLQIVKGRKNRSGGFAYLMPFWFRDSFGLDDETCHLIALGNTFALLYFLSQDEVMDSEDYKGNLLPMSSLFFGDFTACYRTLFPSDSPFWKHWERYMKEWAESVLWERSHHWGQPANYEERDLILLSRKAATLKIPFAAICLKTGRESDLTAFEAMMDYDQVVYQFIDDWRDWQEDIKKNSYTYLLMDVIKWHNLKDPKALTVAHVKKAIYEGDVMERVLDTAKMYNQRSMEAIEKIDAPYIKMYLKGKTVLFRNILNKIETERKAMTDGASQE